MFKRVKTCLWIINLIRKDELYFKILCVFFILFFFLAVYGLGGKK